MQKSINWILLALVLGVGTAFGGTVIPVDFAGVMGESQSDLLAAPVPIGEVTFGYHVGNRLNCPGDDLNSPECVIELAPPLAASISAAGISINPGTFAATNEPSYLTIDFLKPNLSIWVDLYYVTLNAVQPSLGAELIIPSLPDDQIYPTSSTYVANGDPVTSYTYSGHVAYVRTAGGYTQAQIVLPDANDPAGILEIDLVSFSYEPVPEPGAMLLLSSGLLGLGVMKFRKRA